MSTTEQAQNKGNGTLTNAELSAFAEQMSLVLHAGISAMEGISIMKEDAESSRDQQILGTILDEMMTGGYLSPALAASGAFPPYFVQMTEIGERTGNLDSVMDALEKHYDREDSIRKSTRNAVLYPMILTGMMLLVIILLLVKVMPVFNEVFVSLGAEMTGLPAVLLGIGNAIRAYAVIFILLILVILILIFILFRTDAGQSAMRNFTQRFPSARKSRRTVSACRFADAMSMALAAGLTPDEGMEMASGLSEDPDFTKELEACRSEMMEGKGFAAALSERGIFSGIYSRMLSIGQKTGTLDRVMGEIADMYQDEIDTKINNRLATMEPLLVILMSAAIGVIMLSVMFPLLGLMSSM